MFTNICYSRLKRISVFAVLIVGSIVLLLTKSIYPLNNDGDVTICSEDIKNENENVREINFKEKRECYRVRSSFTKSGYLDDILEAKIQPNKGNSIFFLQTTCSKSGIISLNARQACAIESAAIWNPNRHIFVLFASPVGYPLFSTVSPNVISLQSYGNIHLMNINLDNFVLGTPVEQFYKYGTLFKSVYCVTHMSDFLRFLVLYKYGGIYLDLDVVVQQNLDKLPANFCGIEQGTVVNVAVFGLQNEAGHHISELCLREFVRSFNPNEWGYNGPLLLKRILDTFCTKDEPATWCKQMKVFSKNEFYAIEYEIWDQFFEPQSTKFTLNATEHSSVIHLWNALSFGRIINKSEPKSAYEIVAAKNCPISFQNSGQYF